MNLNCFTQNLGLTETAFESTAEQSLDADITLPDYCPDIQRILKCNVTSNVISVQNTSGRVTADADAVIRLVYIGENGRIAAYEQNYPIQKHIESNRINNESAVSVKICINYVNCRAVNSRRADIKSMLTFMFKAINRNEESVLCDSDGAGIQLMKESFNIASVSGICVKTFSMNEVVELSEQKNPVAQIMNLSPFAIIKETKVINNKVLIKGDCAVKINYISDSENSVECIEHSMPISQIIEIDGLNDNNICNIIIDVCSFEAVPKADSSGNMRLIDLNARLNAFVTSYDEIPMSFITDAYSTEYDVRNTYKNIEVCNYKDKINDSFTNKVVLESIGVSVESIIAVWCSDVKYNFTSNKNNLLLNGTYQANVLYRDSDGKTEIIQKTVDFEYSSVSDINSDNLICHGSVQIIACSCSVIGDSKLELKTEINVTGIVLSRINKKIINSISVDENSAKNNKSCALTIYFCNDGEDVWNIARKYNTTVEAVMNENDLTDRIISKGRMMLIPGV